MEIEHIKTKERFTVTWWLGSLKLGMEFYGFKKIEGTKSLWEGFVMNNRQSIDEFGDIDFDDIKEYITKNNFAIGETLKTEVQAPIGFRRII
jgi:hypothetical protein